jgi:RNA polymerase nonessential primary-like sigma factor
MAVAHKKLLPGSPKEDAMLMPWFQREVSIDDRIGANGTGTIETRLADEAAESQEQRLYRKQLAGLVRKALFNLDARERHVIERHFGLSDGDERTLDQIAAGMALSRERVRQIECRAKSKLRKDLIACSGSLSFART